MFYGSYNVFFLLLMVSLRPKNLQRWACYLLSQSTLTLSNQ